MTSFSKLLLLSPFVAYVNGQCSGVADILAAACTCSTNNEAGFPLTSADECASGKTCVSTYGASSGAAAAHGKCITPSATACADVVGGAAISSGCPCTDTTVGAGDEICYGEEDLCVKTGGTGKKCRKTAAKQIFYAADTHACKGGSSAVLARAPGVADGAYCAANNAAIDINGNSNLVCENAAATSGGAQSDGITAGVTGAGACDTSKALICAKAGTSTIVPDDAFCVSGEFCIRGEGTASGGANAVAGFTGYFGSPTCQTAAPTSSTSACTLGTYMPYNSVCKAASAKYCGHGFIATSSTCVAGGTVACPARKGVVTSTNECVCVNPGEKLTNTRNSCVNNQYCVTTELTARAYFGDATCVTGTTANTAVAAITTHCKSGKGDLARAAATTSAVATPCACGMGAICGPGTYCLMGNHTALAGDNDTCLTSAIADCTMTGASAATVGCKCGDSTDYLTCGVGQHCIFSNSTANVYNGNTLTSNAEIKSCMASALATCIDQNATTAATVPCYCAATKNICATGEFCHVSATNVTSCVASAPTAAPTAATTVAPTAAPTAAADEESGSSPITPIIAFAVTVLSLAISALM